ncbi:MAG: DNA primase [Bdellovibrionaceae bacterium]|nr:DNA primase [Pseudobdellovibrionaceae bacterium]
MYSKDFIRKVMYANDLAEIVGEHSVLKQKSNDALVGLCPYPDHSEKTPSFSVSSSKQVYYCFGCKRGGNAYSFLKDIRGFSFIDSVEHLARRGSIPLEKTKTPYKDFKKNTTKEENLKKDFLHLNQKALQYFSTQWANLSKTSKVTQFLSKRNIKPEGIKELSLVFSSPQWSGLVEYAVDNKLDLKKLHALGLVQIKKTSQNKVDPQAGDYYDTLRDRFIFPIHSSQGELLAFGGRAFGDEMPKYINSPEHLLFKKREVLYGLFFSAKHIRSKDYVIVVEGYMDFLSLYQAGIKNVVATLGTALTEGHARILKRYTKNVILLFDGDQAGKQATEKSLPILLQESLYVKTLSLEKGVDPDDFINQFGAQEFKKKINLAQDLFYSILNHSFESYHGGAIDKVKIIDKLQPILNSILDERLKDLYIKELADRLQQTEQWVSEAMKVSKKETAYKKTNPVSAPKLTDSPALKKTSGSEKPNSTETSTERINLNEVYPAELDLINLSLKEESYFLQLFGQKKEEICVSPQAIAFFDKLEQIYRQNSQKFDRLAGEIVNIVFPQSAIMHYMEKPMCDLKNSEANQLMSDCLNKLKTIKARNVAKNLSLKIKSEEFSQDSLEQYMKIQKAFKSPKQSDKATEE